MSRVDAANASIVLKAPNKRIPPRSDYDWYLVIACVNVCVFMVYKGKSVC